MEGRSPNRLRANLWTTGRKRVVRDILLFWEGQIFFHLRKCFFGAQGMPQESSRNEILELPCSGEEALSEEKFTQSMDTSSALVSFDSQRIAHSVGSSSGKRRVCEQEEIKKRFAEFVVLILQGYGKARLPVPR